MAEGTLGSVSILRCPRCLGLLMDHPPALQTLLSESDESLASDLPRQSTPDHRVTLSCPRCDIPMVRTPVSEAPQYHLDQCPDCGMTFVDAAELQAFRGSPG